MTLDELTIPRSLTTRLLFEAQEHPALEVCGLLGGHNRIPATIYPVTNVSDKPHDSFDMESQDQIHAMKTMRNNGEQLLAIYHSHPATPPVPSKRDREEIGYPNAVMLIISLLNTTPEMRAWQHTGNGMAEIPLRVMAME